MSSFRCTVLLAFLFVPAWAIPQELVAVEDCPCNRRLSHADVAGVAFCREHTELIPVEPHTGRFTPSLADILLAETSLASQVDLIDSSRAFDGLTHMPVIRRNLSNYHRQYFGLLNGAGERVLWINFMWSDDIYVFRGWECTYTYVLHADTWFWSIYVNLDTGTCYGLETSGR